MYIRKGEDNIGTRGGGKGNAREMRACCQVSGVGQMDACGTKITSVVRNVDIMDRVDIGPQP
jgi:hypothetical protein